MKGKAGSCKPKGWFTKQCLSILLAIALIVSTTPIFSNGKLLAAENGDLPVIASETDIIITDTDNHIVSNTVYDEGYTVVSDEDNSLINEEVSEEEFIDISDEDQQFIDEVGMMNDKNLLFSSSEQLGSNQPILVVSGTGIITDGTYTEDNISNEKSYTLDELKAMSSIVERNLYSTHNNSDFRRIYLGDGISIEGLLDKSGYTVTASSKLSMGGVTFNEANPLVGRYYFPNIGKGLSEGSTSVGAILAWANKYEQNGSVTNPITTPVIPTETNELSETDLLTVMVGQRQVDDVNNSLFYKGTRNLTVGDPLINPVITIDGKGYTRSDILMLERAEGSYTYSTQGGERTDFVRGVPLSILAQGKGLDEVISFTAADGYDMSKASITVADAIAKNYILAYETGTSSTDLKGIYETAKGNASIVGYFTLYGDGQKPSKLINSISISPADYFDFTDSPYKHINNGGLSGSGPYNIDAITGATLTVEGPGVETTTPILMGDLEETENKNLYRGNYTDNRGSGPVTFSYEGVKVLSIIDGLINKTVEKVDENITIVFKNRWRQDIGSITYSDLKNAETPVILAYGTGTINGEKVAPFVFDKAAGIIEDLGNDDGCLKLVYDKTELPNVSNNPKFVSVAYVYVERGDGRPGFKHSEATNEAYKNTANMEHIITFTGSALGREVNYTVKELEDMVEYDGDLPKAGGVGHRAEYGLSNTTYWYVNEYEGLKLWDLLTTRLGLDANTYKNDENTLVSFAAWDNYKTTAQFSMAQLANPDRFYFYEKSPLDIGTDRPSKADLANEEYHPDNQIGDWVTDNNGYPVKKGYPVMLAYGVNGYPYVRDSRLEGYAGGLGNDGGPIRVIFGKTDGMNRSNPDAQENYAYFYNNGSNQLQRAQEVYIGDDKRYSTHMENPNYTSMKDVLALTVEIRQGGTTNTKTYTLEQLESILYGPDVSKSDRENQGRIEKGYYIHKIYNDSLLEDLFEGVNLWYLLAEDIGMLGVLGEVSFYSGEASESALIMPLTDIQTEGYNSLRNTEGLGMMVAFAKNGYPMVADKNAGYIDTDSITGKTIKNNDGPLMFVRAQTAEEKAVGQPGATVKKLTKIVVDLEPDVYAHTGEYAAYGDNEVSFTGAVKNEGVTLKVSDIEKLQRFMVTETYTVDGETNLYRGIDLNKLLNSSSVGASALLNEVTVTNASGVSKKVTVNDIRSVTKPIILAYGIGKLGADPVGKPLVPDASSSGYDAQYHNSGGPLKLIIDGATAEDCIENVTGINVTASELTGWTHSTGYYSNYKDYTLELSGTNLSKAKIMTVEELESLSDSYKVFDQYKMGNEYYFEGIDLLKLFRDYIGFSGDLESSNISVYAKDGYAVNFSATDLANGINGKPIILAYGQGVSPDNGLPLVDGDDQTDRRDGFDPNIGNAFGPLRLVVHDNSGWCNKWVTSIVVGSGGSVEPPVSYNFILKNKGKDIGYDIPAIKSTTEGQGGEANASYVYTSKDVQKTDYVKGVYLIDLLKEAGIYGDEVKVTINTTDGFENKQDSYRDISLSDLINQNYFLAYDAGESEGNLTYILDTDKNGAESTVRIYRNYDDGSTWLNRLTNIKGITITGGYTFMVYEGTGKPGQLPMSSVRDIVTDANGGIWVGTNGGGAWYKPADSDEFTINTLDTEGYKLESDVVQAIAIDSTGGIWFTQSKTYNPIQAHLNKGVAYLKNGEITYYNTSVPNTIPNDYVQEVQIDNSGNVWFGSFGGLTRYNPTTNTWTSWDQTYKDNDGDSFPAMSVDNLTFDGKGGVWLGFYPTGAGTETDLFVGGFAHMTADGDITSYQYTAEYDPNINSSLLARVWVRDIAIDQKGGTWVVASGSYSDLPNVGGTIWYVDNKGEVTQYTGKELLGPGKLTGNSEIRMVSVDADGGLWFGTSEDGLFYIAKPGKNIPLSVTAQYSGANEAWPNKIQFNNIYAQNIIGEKMYLGSNAGIMIAALKDIAVTEKEPATKIESFTISGVGSEDIVYYVGGSAGRTLKGLPDNAGKVEATYSYDGVTHFVTGSLLSTLLADAGVTGDMQVTIITSDGYTKSSYEKIPYADIIAQKYFVAYDVGEGTETKGKVADTDKSGVTASFRIYRNFDDGNAGSKDNRIKGVIGITVSKPGSGGGQEPIPGDYDLIISGPGVNKTTYLTIEQLKNLPGIKVLTRTYNKLNSWGTRGRDTFEGVYLENLLNVVGLSSSAKSITVSAYDGYQRTFNLDSEELGVYWTDIQGNKIMLAWQRNGSPIGLQLVVGQIDVDHVNNPMWVSGIDSITVNASATSNPGGGTPGAGEQQKEKEQEKAPELPKDNEVAAKTIVDGNKATTEVTATDVAKVIESMKKTREAEGKTDKVVVEINAVSDNPEAVNHAQVILAADTLSTLVKGENVTADIKTDLGNIILSAEVLRELSSKGTEPIVINIQKTEDIPVISQISNRPMVNITITQGSQEISSLGGKYLKAGITYETETAENQNQLLVYYINEHGTATPVKLSQYKPEKGQVLFGTNHLSLYAIGYNEVSFNDINNHWGKDNIEFLAAREIIKGKEANVFDPNGSVTRAEYVTMLANSMDGISIAGAKDAGFTDVQAGDWYTSYVNWAVAKGIVSGFGDKRFAPNEKITREQMALMTDRFIKAMKVQLEKANSKTDFTDQDQINTWSAEAVSNMQQAGIINGTPEGNFVPQGTATRAEAATIIKSYIEALLK